MRHATICINLEDIIQNEISQIQKEKYDFTYMRYLKQTDSQKRRTEQRLQGAGGKGNGELLCNGYITSVWDDEKVLEMDDGNGCTTV